MSLETITQMPCGAAASRPGAGRQAARLTNGVSGPVSRRPAGKDRERFAGRAPEVSQHDAASEAAFAAGRGRELRGATPAWLRAAGAAALLLACALPAAPAAAQNAVPGGRFDSPDSIVGWGAGNTAGYTDVSYQAGEDAGGHPGSGSARASNHYSGSDAVSTILRCVPIVQGKAYYAYARVRFDAGEPAAGYAALWVYPYTSTDCSGSSVIAWYGSFAETEDGRGVWHRLEMGSIAAAKFPAVATAKSALVEIRIWKSPAGGALSIDLDDVFVAPVGEPLCNGLVPTIGGTDGDDEIAGTAGPDVIVGFAGNDVIAAGGADDVICAGKGADVVEGGKGSDAIFGGGGRDSLNGGDGDDEINGGPGNDDLKGRTGHDFLIGGTGTDVCDGGADDDDASGCETTISAH